MCRKKLSPSINLVPKLLGIFLLIASSLASCGRKPRVFTFEERMLADEIVHSVHGIDSLAMIQKRLEEKGDRLGSIVALREWGKELRNESRFEEALSVHSEGLRQSENLGDTLEWVQALNNIGTDYRRMGMLDVAQDYHYRARVLSDEYSDTSYAARKNRLVSINGLGNIYLTMGNYARADSAFRLALKGEQQLDSPLGQAINYANLGAIFEDRGQLDSAWVFYRLSMQFNKEAGSKLGEALCHIYFGSLYEKERNYDDARNEYETAYQMMLASKDDWHSLNTLIALAGIHNETRDGTKTLEYLEKAKRMAEQIKSIEHLVEINTLYYRHFKQQSDFRRALLYHEQAIAMKDSLLNMEMINRIQNISLNIERSRQEREMNDARLRLQQERTARNRVYIVLFFLLVLIALLLYIQGLRSQSHQALKQLSLVRENLFTNITHELRSPLTLILGLSQDLQENDPSEQVKDKAQAIERQGKELLTLINQLLDISKLKSAVIVPDWQNGNITTYLAMIVDTYRDFARSRKIDLQFYAKEDVDMDFVPDYVNKVMGNLLSNAFKFTPEYGKVDVSTWREGERFHLNVTDTGEGMDAETVTHAFEPFFQAESESSHIGTGVGLALVKQIMEIVDGEITIDSKIGQGTTFHLILPIRNNAMRMVSHPANHKPVLPEFPIVPEDSETDDNQCQLLVIEDNRNIASYIGSQFADRYAISYAANGQEGLEKALALVPDIIITDLMMPGLDGLEVCRQIRSNEIINHIPIIVVTAKVTEEDRIRGIEAGVDAYVTKPFNNEELRTLVENLLDRHRRLRHKYSENTIADSEKDMQLTATERLFLTKAVDHIFLLMDKGGIDVNTLADNLCMSPRQFHRKIIALTGDTPASYILKVRMQRARQLLESRPGMTIEEIAERCGFEHTSSFYHSFKKMYGITPAKFRKRGL